MRTRLGAKHLPRGPASKHRYAQEVASASRGAKEKDQVCISALPSALTAEPLRPLSTTHTVGCADIGTFNNAGGLQAAGEKAGYIAAILVSGSR